MAGRKPIGRKRRPRQHVIADLGVNHVERHALQCGYSVERVLRDYGLDLTIYTFDAAGEVQNGYKGQSHILFAAKTDTLA
jgi:hypothetical protein